MRRVSLALIHADARTNMQKKRVEIRIIFATASINASEQRMLLVYWKVIGKVPEKLKSDAENSGEKMYLDGVNETLRFK